ncbi:MAG: polysaccharide biosynthesis tyrosine autokinase, partial [Desulfobaccales bacterium]
MSNHDQPLVAVGQSPIPQSSLSTPLSLGYDNFNTYGRLTARDYVYVLLKHKWLIIITFLSIVFFTGFYTYTRTPIFSTSAMLQITQDNPGSQVSVDPVSRYLDYDSLEKFQMTQYKILQSRSLALRVIQALKLQEHPDFKPARVKNHDISETDIEEGMVNSFLSKLKVTPIRNSYLLEVSFQSPDKFLTQRVVNAIANEYMYLSIDRRGESFALVRKWLDKQLQEMAAKVYAGQKELYKFGQQTDIYTSEDKDNVIVHKFIDLNALLTKAQAEEMAKEAQYQEIKDKGPNAPLIVNNALVSSLRLQLVAQQAKVSSMQKVFLSGHPEMQAAKAHLAELQSRLQSEIQRLTESVKADYEAAKRTKNLLSDSFSAQKEQMSKLQNNLTEYQMLKRNSQTNEQFYLALLSRVKETNIASSMVPSNISVIDSAPLPDVPISPKTRRDLMMGAFLGLMLGVGLALLREHLDDSIKSPDDLERACNLFSLGNLPKIDGSHRIMVSYQGKPDSSAIFRYFPRLQRGNQSPMDVVDLDLVVYKHPRHRIAEALRHTHTSIMFSMSGRPPSAIMISSPNPAEGKTMVASNLALSFAMTGHQVVLIDCDTRKPRVHQIFQLDLKPGLTNYLTGNATLEEVLRLTSIPNLTIISAGT